VFDLRYHVASLAAVFLALVLGIVIGAAISDPSLADRAENRRLKDSVERLQADLDAATLRTREDEAGRAYADASYQAVVHDRLAGAKVLFVSIGAADARIDEAAEAVVDAGGRVARERTIDLPKDIDALMGRLEARPSLAAFAEPDGLRELGREFARELVEGGDTPVEDALEDVLVQQRSPGRDSGPVDAVVIGRTGDPRQGPLAPFLTGFYEGLADGTPAVAVDRSGSPEGSLRAFSRADLSTVNGVDTVAGKVALVVLLAGAERGDYGLGAETTLPPIEPHEPDPGD
jgi:hypothetical protein